MGCNVLKKQFISLNNSNRFLKFDQGDYSELSSFTINIRVTVKKIKKENGKNKI